MYMWLTQTGPDQDAVGELVSRRIAESNDIDSLKAIGLEIAAALGAEEVMWSWGPVCTWHSLEVTPERCYLAIRP
jgi:hypothetical protein